MVTQLFDTLMVGQLGAQQLASASFANAVFALLLVFSIGVVTGITTLTGNAFGANDKGALSQIAGNGFWSTLLFALLLCGAALLAKPLFYHMGQQVEVVNNSLSYFNLLAFSLVPLVGFLSLKHFYDGMEWTTPGMYISLIANAVNILLNYLFIYGKMGFPAMGIVGAGWATLISRLLMMLIAVAILHFHRKNIPYRKALVKVKFEWQQLKNIFKLGFPIGAQYFLEAGAFILAALVIGTLGSNELAAHQIAISIASFTYMFATGLSTTATIRVSQLVGAKNLDKLPLISKSLYLMILATESCFALLIVVFHRSLPVLFVPSEVVQQLAAELLLVAAFFQLTDGIQVLAMGALRGLSDVKRPTSIALISYWIISLPVGYYLMKTLDMGATGVWFGLLTGLSVAAVLLTWRYYLLGRKMRDQSALNRNQPYI